MGNKMSKKVVQQQSRKWKKKTSMSNENSSNDHYNVLKCKPGLNNRNIGELARFIVN